MKYLAIQKSQLPRVIRVLTVLGIFSFTIIMTACNQSSANNSGAEAAFAALDQNPYQYSLVCTETVSGACSNIVSSTSGAPINDPIIVYWPDAPNITGMTQSEYESFYIIDREDFSFDGEGYKLAIQGGIANCQLSYSPSSATQNATLYSYRGPGKILIKVPADLHESIRNDISWVDHLGQQHNLIYQSYVFDSHTSNPELSVYRLGLSNASELPQGAKLVYSGGYRLLTCGENWDVGR